MVHSVDQHTVIISNQEGKEKAFDPSCLISHNQFRSKLSAHLKDFSPLQISHIHHEIQISIITYAVTHVISL